MKTLIIIASLLVSIASHASTIGSYENLSTPGTPFGEFLFLPYDSATIQVLGEGSLLVLRGKNSKNQQTLCMITSDLAKKSGVDLTSLLTLIKLSPDSEVICQNRQRADGSVYTQSLSITISK